MSFFFSGVITTAVFLLESEYFQCGYQDRNPKGGKSFGLSAAEAGVLNSGSPLSNNGFNTQNFHFSIAIHSLSTNFYLPARV
jgi:hypothetical protein